MPHISELIQYQGGGRELALRKAASIERICGSWAFRYIGDIVEAEGLTFAASKGIYKLSSLKQNDFPVNAEGFWHPDLGPLFKDIEKSIDKQLNEELNTIANLNRSLKRKIKHQTKSNLRSPLMRQQYEEHSQKLLADYPLTEKFVKENMFVKFLYKEIGYREMENELLFSLRMPSKFVTWYFEKHDGNKDLPYWMKSIGAKFSINLENMIEKLKDNSILVEGAVRKATMVRMAEQIPLNLADRLLPNIIPTLKRGGASQRQIDALMIDPERNNLPTLNLFSRIVGEYTKDVISSHASARKIKDSDFGDIIHALYVPYCDVWRGDDYSAELVTRACRGGSTRIVRKLQNLPNILSEVLDG